MKRGNIPHLPRRDNPASFQLMELFTFKEQPYMLFIPTIMTFFIEFWQQCLMSPSMIDT